MSRRIEVRFFAVLRETAGKRSETLDTDAVTVRALYEELRTQYGFTLPVSSMRVAIHDAVQPWDTPLQDGDVVTFIPPVAGG